ncbi:MAG: hypothetical protein JWO44_2652 [Bacteroidetes bacterium]|nr:hypothetical protein [Bacteroidota bacterium]
MKYSLWSIILIFAFILSIFFSFNIWKKNRIIIDAPSYYTYLPATFIYGDLHLNFIDRNPAFFKNRIWYYKIKDGKRLIKHPVGISVALSPFFLAGHLAAKITGGLQDGYSLCYQNAASIGVLFYLFIGLFYLRKLLLNYFSEKITALTLISIVLGTNLLWYSSFEGLMPHAISFSLLCVCLYHFYAWLKNASRKNLLLFAAVFGLSILIRPLALTIGLYFLVVAVLSKGGFRQLWEFLQPQLGNIILALFLVIAIASLQLMYWKYATGYWIYDVYIDEHFVFSSPQMSLFLFSFRKGVFVYTPILLFAVIGFIRLYKIQRAIFYGTVILMPVTVFLLSSWWAWSYGICWGMRPMIDYYSLLSIPLASGFAMLFSKKMFAFIGSALVVLLIALNLFQTWQYKNGLIHYDDMTRKAYIKGFFQTRPSPEWQDLLRPYDWDRRIKGLPQIENYKAYFESCYGRYYVYFRGANMQYVAINPKAQNAVAAYAKEYSADVCSFTVRDLGNGTAGIVSSDEHFLSVSSMYDNVLIANADRAGANELFEIVYLEEDDNRIALKSKATGKYVTMSPAFPNILFATADTIGRNEIFRLFVIEVNQARY